MRLELKVALCAYGILLMLGVGCSKAESVSGYDDIIDRVKNKYPFARDYDWQNDKSSSSIDETSATLYLSRSDGDTTIQLVVDFAILEKEEYIWIRDYLKAYSMAGRIHSIHYDENEDTLYYFKMDPSDYMNIEFVVGEYEYLYERGDIDSLEAHFYEANRDSLKKVRGNKLRPLPRLKN